MNGDMGRENGNGTGFSPLFTADDCFTADDISSLVNFQESGTTDLEPAKSYGRFQIDVELVIRHCVLGLGS